MATGIPTCRRAGRCRVQHHPSARVGGRHTLAACSPPSPPSHPLLLSHKAPAPHPDPPCLQRNKDLSMVVDKEVSESAAAGLNASVEKAVDGSLDKKTQEKAPKKTHKAEREKLKRDQLNDLFLELGSMLDLDRQNSGKATVLGDAARALRDLVTQVESLRKEHASLLTECQYVTSEKNELREENTVLQTQISELQNELRASVASNSRNLGSFTMSHPIGSNIPSLATHPVPHQMWSNAPNLSTLAMTHPMNSLSLSQHQATEVGQVHLSPPQELQLFPETSASQQHDRSRHRSTPTTSATLTNSLPGQLRLSLPRTAEEELSSGVSGNRKEPKNG